jgi:hypothetical protein
MSETTLMNKLTATFLVGVLYLGYSARFAADDVSGKEGLLAQVFTMEGTGYCWALFNLIVALLDLFIALGLIAHLGFSILRSEKLEEEAWERMKPPQTLDDVERITAQYDHVLGESEDSTERIGQSIVFQQFCTSACVGLALVGLIVFCIVEKLNACMVLFDTLSPLFALLLTLTLAGAVLTLGCGKKRHKKRLRS